MPQVNFQSSAFTFNLNMYATYLAFSQNATQNYDISDRKLSISPTQEKNLSSVDPKSVAGSVKALYNVKISPL